MPAAHAPSISRFSEAGWDCTPVDELSIDFCLSLFRSHTSRLFSPLFLFFWIFFPFAGITFDWNLPQRSRTSW